MYPRLLAGTLRSSPRSVLLLGPRQVGKSTLLAALQPDLTLNMASPGTFRDFVRHPERLEQELLATPSSIRTVFIDEVQRVPALLDVVQVVLDQHPRRFRFLLSGSSARKLRRGRANSSRDGFTSTTCTRCSPAICGASRSRRAAGSTAACCAD